MPQILYQYLADDHNRLDGLLTRSTVKSGVIDMKSYSDFRKGLLRHIGIEERIVLPAIAKLQGGRPAAIADRIRLDHSALVSLLVPPPSPSIIATIRAILAPHNGLEEQEGGLYQVFERLVGPNADTFLQRFVATPEVPVLPHNERPETLDATRRAVARAGYVFIDVP